MRLEGRVRKPSWRRGARAKDIDMHYERMNQKEDLHVPCFSNKELLTQEMKLIALCV